ncbi:MAG TPA: hypothetical protein GX512_01945 [Firmicutes bacterium]|nr:hypothetical protein [Candidatus Fermentithermobacillaceae bacterium]
MICPKCRSRATGRIGQNQYYCWDCSIEFVPTGDGFRMYRLEPDGTTVLDSLEAVSPRDQVLGDGMLTGTVIDGVPPGETEDMKVAGQVPGLNGKSPA